MRLVRPRFARSQSPFRAPSSNHDEGCPPQLDSGPTVLRQEDDSRICETRRFAIPLRGAQFRYRFQLQMPPDLHGQTWIRVSNACASKGLPWPQHELGAAATRGFSERICATWCWESDSFGLTSLDSAGRFRARHAPSLARSTFASTRTGANSDGGPSGFGEAAPWKGRGAGTRRDDTHRQPMHRSMPAASHRFVAMQHSSGPIRGLLKCSKHCITLSSRKRDAQFQPIVSSRYRAPMLGGAARRRCPNYP